MIDDIETDPRVAGEIARYHTWPVTKKQSVGEHSWQVLRIILSVWPAVPRRLLVHAVLHDVGEMAGDLPFPVKKNDPVLKQRMDAAESAAHEQMSAIWNLPRAVVLSDYERQVFKLCENLEMWEFSLQQQNLGNRYAAVMALRMLTAASILLNELDPPSGDYPDLRPAVRRYVEHRKRQERGEHNG